MAGNSVHYFVRDKDSQVSLGCDALWFVNRCHVPKTLLHLPITNDQPRPCPYYNVKTEWSNLLIRTTYLFAVNSSAMVGGLRYLFSSVLFCLNCIYSTSSVYVQVSQLPNICPFNWIFGVPSPTFPIFFLSTIEVAKLGK